MRVLILGAGAIGGWYGARLIEAGAKVEFLVRSARAANLAQNGLCIRTSSELRQHEVTVREHLRMTMQPIWSSSLAKPMTSTARSVRLRQPWPMVRACCRC